MKINEIIVVEGKDDTKRIKLAVEADTIETNGSAINDETLEMIAKAQAVRGVIVLTDPDYPGSKIRDTIARRVPAAKHAFLRKEDTLSPHGGSLGIEHAAPEMIREALKNVYTPKENFVSDIDRNFLRRMRLIEHPAASGNRQLVCDKLGIGHANGKQLLNRLRMFEIRQQDVIEAMLAVRLLEERTAEREERSSGE